MRHPSWKQDTPVKQYAALVSAVYGSVSNAREGINVAASLQRAEDFLEQLCNLCPYLEKDPQRWIED